MEFNEANDFRLPICDFRLRRKRMDKTSWMRFLVSCSGNRKSKTCTERGRSIQNLKWAGFLAILVVLVGCVGMAEAQQPAKVPKIGWLFAVSGPSTQVEFVRRELRALDYVEGKNIAIEPRYAEGKLDRLRALADELVRLKVDVLLASSTLAALAAQNATRMIPIVFVNVSDPVAVGLIDSLARPGGNITGITNIAAGL